jgi:hypothetical protein
MPRQAHVEHLSLADAPGERPTKLLSWATSLEAAQADFGEKVVESAATADSAKMAALTRVVDGIAGGTLLRRDSPLTNRLPIAYALACRRRNGIRDRARSERRAPGPWVIDVALRGDEERSLPLSMQKPPLYGQVDLRGMT